MENIKVKDCGILGKSLLKDGLQLYKFGFEEDGDNCEVFFYSHTQLNKCFIS